MHRLEVAKWALENSFTRESSYTLVAPYESFTVRLVIGYQFLTTFALHETSKDILARISHSELFIDDNEMLHGAGLNSAFINRMIRGQPAPSWFPEHYKMLIEGDVARTTPKATRFG